VGATRPLDYDRAPAQHSGYAKGRALSAALSPIQHKSLESFR